MRHINTSKFYEDLAKFRDKIDENPFEDIFAAIETGSHIKLHEILTFTPELTLIAINGIDDFNILGSVSQFFEFALEKFQPKCADIILQYAYSLDINLTHANIPKSNKTDDETLTIPNTNPEFINSQIEFYLKYYSPM